MERVMSADKSIIDSDPQSTSSSARPLAQHRLWHWLSTGLIVIGVLLLGTGGAMAYLNYQAVVDPPSPVGAVESLPVSGLEGNPLPAEVNSDASVNQIDRGLPPGLEQNPLPVFPEEGMPGAEVDNAAPVLSPGLNPVMSSSAPGTEGIGTGQGSQGALDQLMREAGQVVPGGPLQTTLPNSVPAATNPPTRIVAPAIDLDSEVVSVGWKLAVQGGKPVSVWEVAEYAAGWHKNSALPGTGGNVVLSGHHNTKGEVFRYIVDLKPGDTVTLYADNQPYTYTVESRFVVRDKGASEEKRRENARWIGRFPDERLTLVTCWPYRNNTHRVIVVAKPAG